MSEPIRAAAEDESRGPALIALARAAIAERLGAPEVRWTDAPWLDAPGATFVTLTIDGELRGCIGVLEACRSLRVDVRENAIGAAFRDTRFPPLTRNEFTAVRVEVSELSSSEPMEAKDEATVLRRLRPGVDGLILQCGPRRSTFLPQVWDDLSEPSDFLGHLKRKAGLPAEFWSPEITLRRYTARKWREA